MACSFFLFANDLVAFYVSGLHFVFSFAWGGCVSFWLGLCCFSGSISCIFFVLCNGWNPIMKTELEAL
jgi:uncharacterized membrane protein YgdD (TMEM256/DUF423 family)